MNGLGEGESREIAESVIIKDQVEIPEIILPEYMMERVKFRVGQTMKLKARIQGKPVPDVEWIKGGAAVNENRATLRRYDFDIAI